MTVISQIRKCLSQKTVDRMQCYNLKWAVEQGYTSWDFWPMGSENDILIGCYHEYQQTADRLWKTL